jgi:hypothetical protein
MKRKRFSPGLERLEDRTVPALDFGLAFSLGGGDTGFHGGIAITTDADSNLTSIKNGTAFTRDAFVLKLNAAGRLGGGQSRQEKEVSPCLFQSRDREGAVGIPLPDGRGSERPIFAIAGMAAFMARMPRLDENAAATVLVLVTSHLLRCRLRAAASRAALGHASWLRSPTHLMDDSRCCRVREACCAPGWGCWADRPANHGETRRIDAGKRVARPLAAPLFPWRCGYASERL